jgi:hypothetical protein
MANSKDEPKPWGQAHQIKETRDPITNLMHEYTLPGLHGLLSTLRWSMLSQCARAGVSPEVAATELEFILHPDSSGDVRLIPCTMFTYLASLGIIRDPELLKHFVCRETDPVTGGWKETFVDERGIWIRTHTPPDGWECSMLPNTMIGHCVDESTEQGDGGKP